MQPQSLPRIDLSRSRSTSGGEPSNLEAGVAQELNGGIAHRQAAPDAAAAVAAHKNWRGPMHASCSLGACRARTSLVWQTGTEDPREVSATPCLSAAKGTCWERTFSLNPATTRRLGSRGTDLRVPLTGPNTKTAKPDAFLGTVWRCATTRRSWPSTPRQRRRGLSAAMGVRFEIETALEEQQSR
jgi:hypothetical protein